MASKKKIKRQLHREQEVADELEAQLINRVDFVIHDLRGGGGASMSYDPIIHGGQERTRAKFDELLEAVRKYDRKRKADARRAAPARKPTRKAPARKAPARKAPARKTAGARKRAGPR